MQALRIVMLLVVLAVGYLLFFRSQPKASDLPPKEAAASVAPGAKPAATPRTQYKEAMDRAHAAAQQMKDGRAEADSF